MRNLTFIILLIAGAAIFPSCEKLVEIDPPIDSIPTSEMFKTDEQAKTAMAGVYSKMINGEGGKGAAFTEFAGGMTSIIGGYSADELNTADALLSNEQFNFNTNKISFNNSISPALWTSAYTTIYGANAVIEGIAASTSSRLSADLRKKLTAESKFIRAFSYFYLVNFFGDVPKVLTVDFNQTRLYKRAPVAELYEQMIEDLLAAQADLPPVNTNKGGERVYPDKWAATAMLARVYLYAGEYDKAFIQSSAVIANSGHFILEPEPVNTFLKNSREAIFQLKQNTAASPVGNATAEGYALVATGSSGNSAIDLVRYFLPEYLVNAFEPGDKRFRDWVGVSTTNTTGNTLYYAHKYKTGSRNRIVGGAPTEFYMVLRLAEQYLIRAEASAHGAAALSDAIDDLNVIRGRAGLGDLPYTLTQPEVLEAIEKERRVELFLEWAHRWFDLKRTGKAASVLSQYSIKQPWEGDYQLLYPIPPDELQTNPNLTPNPGYF